MSSIEIGLFLVKYQVGTGELGAPTLSLSLAVNAVHRTIHGIGEITQTVNPPVDVHTRVDGTYLPILILGSPSLLVEATGMPPVHWPDRRRPQGPGPVILTNFFLRMVLQSWEGGGTAYYRYQNAEGQWVEVTDVPVKKVDVLASKAA
ncbi:MAG TPA: DUF1842 domain-containing protein [Thermoanaerobaculia bacterium]|jgi:hypothetical protein|nr:DUF1842 domain-containing protein [Thermoanaerobaculia bacterium]